MRPFQETLSALQAQWHAQAAPLQARRAAVDARQEALWEADRARGGPSTVERLNGLLFTAGLPQIPQEADLLSRRDDALSSRLAEVAAPLLAQTLDAMDRTSPWVAAVVDTRLPRIQALTRGKAAIAAARDPADTVGEMAQAIAERLQGRVEDPIRRGPIPADDRAVLGHLARRGQRAANQWAERLEALAALPAGAQTPLAPGAPDAATMRQAAQAAGRFFGQLGKQIKSLAAHRQALADARHHEQTAAGLQEALYQQGRDTRGALDRERAGLDAIRGPHRRQMMEADPELDRFLETLYRAAPLAQDDTGQMFTLGGGTWRNAIAPRPGMDLDGDQPQPAPKPTSPR